MHMYGVLYVLRRVLYLQHNNLHNNRIKRTHRHIGDSYGFITRYE